MKRLLIATILSLTCHSVVAEEAPMPWEFLDELSDIATSAEIRVLHKDTTKFVDTPLVSAWGLGHVDIHVFLQKLNYIYINQKKLKPHKNPLKIEQPSQTYQGIAVRISDQKGRVYSPLRFFQGGIYTKEGKQVLPDIGREFEYWLFSTNAQVPGSRLLAWQVLPIISYSQCLALKNPIVWTAPPQCLLPNDEIFLGLQGYTYADVPPEPTQDALKIKNFDDCLVHGHAIINTFPRQCVAAGGHVYKEPPRLPEAPEAPAIPVSLTTVDAP